MIKVNKLNKYYHKGRDNEIHVIKDTSLELPSNGLVAFLGPSGSGKTTLLNVLGGLDSAKGDFKYDDFEMSSYKMSKIDHYRRKNIGYIFQNYNLLLNETVYDNLAIALELIGVLDPNEIEKRIQYTLKAVGMYKYRKKRAYALSGGQQQRVSIARALVKNCKVIIADEPTGNLDSENSIEILNILKKISEKTLVLLVTHNEKLAQFYADQIIRINDGEVLEQTENHEERTLQTVQNNKVYLKDLTHHEEHNEIGNIEVYSDEEKIPKIDFKIIYRNNTVYIESNQKLKLLENTNLEIIDDHYQDMNLKTLETFDYDTTWFQDVKSKKKSFNRFWNNIKQSFFKMKNVRKRTKIIYASFFMFGTLFAISVIGFTNYIDIDDTNLTIEYSYEELDTKDYPDYYEIRDIMEEAASKGIVENLQSPNVYYYTLSRTINSQENIYFNFSASTLGYTKDKTFLVGKAPSKGEVVISEDIANRLIKMYGFYYRSYNDILGESISNGVANEFQISGIVSGVKNIAYLYDADYICLDDYDTIFYSLLLRDYVIESQNKTYTIVSGRDFTPEDYDQGKILIPYGKDDSSVTLAGEEYEVIGTFKMNDFGTSNNEYITYRKEKYEGDFVYTSRRYYQNKDITLIEGRNPESYKECVVSIYSPYKLGQNIDGYEVVGIYNGSYSDVKTIAYYDRDTIIISNGFNFWFNVKDAEAFAELTGERYFPVSVYNKVIGEAKENQKAQFILFGILSLVVILVSVIFIFFMMRSKMISSIYSIGVYRSIGASKKKILSIFLWDVIVLVTFTSLIGYLLTLFFFGTIAHNVNQSFNMIVLKFNFFYSFIGVVLLYIANIIFGLLPIWLLMRKTPSEILSKYDI